MAILDAIRFAACGSFAGMAMLLAAVGLLAGSIVAILWEVVSSSSPGLRWRRALLVAAALAAISFAGLVTMRDICGPV